jgi:hypothetical protein
MLLLDWLDYGARLEQLEKKGALSRESMFTTRTMDPNNINSILILDRLALKDCDARA